MSFYPAGWDYDRLLNCSREELAELSDQERLTMLNGLKEAGLYEQLIEIANQRNERAQKARQNGSWPPYVGNLTNVFKSSDPDDWTQWGYVIFRTCCYQPEEQERWLRFRCRWDQLIKDEISDYVQNSNLSLDRAIELHEDIWVEDPALEGASIDEIVKRFTAINPNLARGIVSTACLVVNELSLTSVLESTSEGDNVPWALAVSLSASDTSEAMLSIREKDRFRVAIESISTQLYAFLGPQTIDLSGLGRCIEDEKDVWCRYGFTHRNET